jgi:putative ABC transport system permease protein
MGAFLQDLRYGARNLARAPGFTLVAMLTLALGVGANTTIFSVINGTLLKPLPFPEPDRVVMVLETFGKGSDNWNILSAPNFWDFERQAKSFENMAIFDSAGRGYNLSPTGNARDAEQVSGLRVTAGFFKVLGVAPFLGRTFLKEEETLGKDREVVLSYGLWQRRYGADPTLVGRSIRLDGDDFTVVGVMPPDFQWEFWSGPRQLWVPVGYTKTDFGRGNNSFLGIARLKSGVTVEQARVEMQAIGARIAAAYPKDDVDMGGTAEPVDSIGMKGIRITLLTLLGAVAFVLLIACVNVANLLLSRGAARQKEFAIRRALGAGGARIARQMLTESVLLGLAGGAAGLAVAFGATRLLFRVFRLDGLQLPLRVVDSIPMDGRVFAFALAVSCLTGILFGIAPALSVGRGDVNDTLKDGSRGSSGGGARLRHALVACEVALALLVLCGAGLMIKSMTRLLGVDPGLNPKNVLAMAVTLPQEEIYVGPPGTPNFCRDLEQHAGAIPGVVAVGAAAHLPMRGAAGRSFQIEGRPPAEPGHFPGGSYTVACPGYFRAMGIPVVKGREFTQQDTLTSPGVIIINERMAHDYWPNEDPIGRAIRFEGANGSRLTIVGVTGDVRLQGLDSPARRQFFRPYTQAGWPVMQIVVRTIATPGRFLEPVKRALADFAPDRPVSSVATMEEIIESSTGSRRLPMLLLSGFALIALVLAAVGIVGVVGHSVIQRTHEIGIRMALGAGTADVLRLMVTGSMAWVVAGLLIGAAASSGLTRLMTGMLYEVRPLDPAVLGGVAALLAVVALAASYIPARRAAKIDPITALRCD